METKSFLDSINTMEDIFIIGGKKLEDIISPSDTKDEAAYKVLKFGISVINEGVKVDHSNYDQTKYEPRFYHESGRGLSYDYCIYWTTSTDCGPRLCYLSYKGMTKGIEVMSDWYNDYLNS